MAPAFWVDHQPGSARLTMEGPRLSYWCHMRAWAFGFPLIIVAAHFHYEDGITQSSSSLDTGCATHPFLGLILESPCPRCSGNEGGMHHIEDSPENLRGSQAAVENLFSRGLKANGIGDLLSRPILASAAADAYLAVMEMLYSLSLPGDLEAFEATWEACVDEVLAQHQAQAQGLMKLLESSVTL